MRVYCDHNYAVIVEFIDTCVVPIQGLVEVLHHLPFAAKKFFVLYCSRSKPDTLLQ